MKLGSRDVKAVRVGDRAVARVLLGDRLVWEAGGPPSGGFPQVVSITTGAGNGPGEAYDVPLPAGSGGLLLVFAKSSTGTQSSWGAPAGWTKVAEADPTSFYPLAVFARVADGTEPETLTFPVGSGNSAALIAYRISGAHGTVQAAPGEGTSPPSVTPAWGAANTLWVTCRGQRRDDGTFTAPSGYEGFTVAKGSGSGAFNTSSQMATAHRELNAATHQPPDFGFSGTVNGRNYAVVAIRPA